MMAQPKFVVVVGISVLVLLVNSFSFWPYVRDIAAGPDDPRFLASEQQNFFNSSAGVTKPTTATEIHDTAKINVSDEFHLEQHPHPHAGAKDAQGNWGYIHDAKFLHRHSTPLHPFTIAENERDEICAPPGQGYEGGMGAYQLLTENIRIRTDAQLHNGSSPLHNNDIKLFCAVYTHAGSSRMTVAALETWARRCDGFMAASTVTDAAKGMVHLPHGGNHYGQYKGIWQKVRSMMTYIYTHYGDEYDYFHFNGDDVFLIVENLKAFLQEKRPRYVGMWRSAHHMKHWSTNLAKLHPDFYYPLGGAGYTMSQDTLRQLVQEIFPVCESTTDESDEDYYVARCLWPAGIRAEPYWDETGANLYNPGGWNYYEKKLMRGSNWKKSHRAIARYHSPVPPFPKSLPQAISNISVSFHLVKTPAAIRRYERLIYRRFSNETECAVIAEQVES